MELFSIRIRRTFQLVSTYIRDILGHVNVQTTEIYARADSKVKREAIEKAYIKVVQEVDTKPMWQGNEKLMDFLKSF